MKKQLLFFHILFSIGFFSFSVAQNEDKNLSNTKHKIGFSFGLGKNNGLGFTNIEIDQDYEVILFQFQHYYKLAANKHIGLELLTQPQFNIARFETLKKYDTTIELGVNLGILIRTSFSDEKFSIYGLIGAGPHYLTNTPSRQSDGFIFSDNFFGGINYKYSKQIYLDFRLGKRHMSNLGLQSRNGGINTFIISVGLFKLL